MPSFRQVQRLGFLGPVPQVQRDHYVARAQNAYGCSLGQAEATEEVAMYLGTVWARTRLELVCPLEQDEHGPIPPLKFSVLQQAPGSPRSLEKHRLEYVASDRSKSSGQKVPPWCGIGVFRCSTAGIKPTIVSSTQLESFQFQHQATLHLNNSDSSAEVSLSVLLIGA